MLEPPKSLSFSSSFSISSSSCGETYLQLSLYAFDVPVLDPKSDDGVDAVFKLKKFIPFIMFDDPMVLEKVEADRAA